MGAFAVDSFHPGNSKFSAKTDDDGGHLLIIKLLNGPLKEIDSRCVSCFFTISYSSAALPVLKGSDLYL